jgi:hypothetical protein
MAGAVRRETPAHNASETGSDAWPRYLFIGFLPSVDE